MNLSRSLPTLSNILYRIGLKSRMLLPRQQCQSFGTSKAASQKIGRIYVINLDREFDRWAEMRRELSRVLDLSGAELAKLAVRYPAVDARNFAQPPPGNDEVVPFYTLRGQLCVEPQPRVLPERVELDRPIRMSGPEIAVARSHIGVWRRVAAGNDAYALVVEDDVWFQRAFARHLDRAWAELEARGSATQLFDVLYLSYKEVKNGAQKAFLSRAIAPI